MKIEYQDSFVKKLNRQVARIAKDKPTAARKFKNELLSKCQSLVISPFRNRKSIYFERDDIRDMIFKGYVIVYKIDTNLEIISVFALTKYQNELK